MSGIFVIGVLVADGLGAEILSNFGVEPSARIFSASLAGQGESPLSEMLLQFALFQVGEISNLFDTEGMQVALHDFADARNLAHIERRQELRLFTRDDPEDAVGLGLRGGNLGNQSGASDSDRTIQARLGLHSL